MNKIAFIIGETFLYWNSIFLALGVLTAVCLFLAFYLGRSGNGIGGFLAVPFCIVFSMVLSRLVHWYCKADSYASLPDGLCPAADPGGSESSPDAGHHGLGGNCRNCCGTACLPVYRG